VLTDSACILGAVAFSAEILMAATPVALAGMDPTRVQVADLDLNSDVDIAVLEQRIATAVRAACRAPDRISDPLIGYRRCIADTTASARAQLDQSIGHSRSQAVQSSRQSPAGAAR